MCQMWRLWLHLLPSQSLRLRCCRKRCLLWRLKRFQPLRLADCPLMPPGRCLPGSGLHCQDQLGSGLHCWLRPVQIR